MKITLNGKEKELPDSISIKEAVEEVCSNPSGVVAELNEEIIRKKEWRKKRLKDGDVLELIAFMGGG